MAPSVAGALKTESGLQTRATDPYSTPVPGALLRWPLEQLLRRRFACARRRASDRLASLGSGRGAFCFGARALVFGAGHFDQLSDDFGERLSPSRCACGSDGEAREFFGDGALAVPANANFVFSVGLGCVLLGG